MSGFHLVHLIKEGTVQQAQYWCGYDNANAAKTTERHKADCAACLKAQVAEQGCDCGHPPSKPKATHHGSMGYGYQGYGANQKTMCFDCCTANDREHLKTASQFWGYLSGDGAKLTNWPGDEIGQVIHTGRLHPWSRERRYIRVRDCHGQQWHGTGAPGMYAALKRSKS